MTIAVDPRKNRFEIAVEASTSLGETKFGTMNVATMSECVVRTTCVGQTNRSPVATMMSDRPA